MARRITYTTKEILSLYQPYDLPCDISVYGSVGSVESEKPIFTQIPTDVGVQAPVVRAPQRSLSDGTRQWNPQPIKDFSPINKFPEVYVSTIPNDKAQSQNEFANDEFTSVLQTKPESSSNDNFTQNPQQIPMGYTQQYVQQFPQQQMPMGTQPYGFAYPSYQGYPYYIQQMVGTYYPQMQAYPQQNAFYGGNDPSAIQMPNYPPQDMPQQVPIQNLRPNPPPAQSQNQSMSVPNSVSVSQPPSLPNNRINSLINGDPGRPQPMNPNASVSAGSSTVFSPLPIDVHDNFVFNPTKITDSGPVENLENSENSEIDFFEPVLEPTFHDSSLQPQLKPISSLENNSSSTNKVPVGIPMPQHMQLQLQDRDNLLKSQNHTKDDQINSFNNNNHVNKTAPLEMNGQNPRKNNEKSNNIKTAQKKDFSPRPIDGFRSAPGIASKGMRGEGMPRFWIGYS